MKTFDEWLEKNRPETDDITRAFIRIGWNAAMESLTTEQPEEADRLRGEGE